MTMHQPGGRDLRDPRSMPQTSDPHPDHQPSRPYDRRGTDSQISLLYQQVERVETDLAEMTKDLKSLTEAMNRQRGAFFLGNLLVGISTTLLLGAGSWAFGRINQAQLDLRETQQKLVEVSNLLQGHAQLEFHSSAYPALRQMETELTALRITLQRMDEEQKRRGGGR